MKFLTDENIGFDIIYPFRELGFDILSVLEAHRGAADETVLSLANKEERIIITADKDFGELEYANKLAHYGVVLLRLKKDSSENKLQALKNLFSDYGEKLNYLAAS